MGIRCFEVEKLELSGDSSLLVLLATDSDILVNIFFLKAAVDRLIRQHIFILVSQLEVLLVSKIRNREYLDLHAAGVFGTETLFCCAVGVLDTALNFLGPFTSCDSHTN